MQTGPLQPLRERGGVTERWAAKPADPGERTAARMHPPGKGGHVGNPAALSSARSPSSSLPLPQLAVCLLGLLLPTRGRGESSSLSSTVAPLHSASQSYLQSQGVLAPPGAARSVPASAPRSAVSCLGRLGRLCARSQAPRTPAHPLGRDSVLRCPPTRFPFSPTPALPPSSRFAALLASSVRARVLPRVRKPLRIEPAFSPGAPSSASPCRPPAAQPRCPLPGLRPVPLGSPSWASRSRPGSARRSAPLSSGPPLAPASSLLALPGALSAAARGAGAPAHHRSARAAAAAAAAAAGTGARAARAGGAGARRAEQPWGSLGPLGSATRGSRASRGSQRPAGPAPGPVPGLRPRPSPGSGGLGPHACLGALGARRLRHLAPPGAICQPRPGCALRTRTARPSRLSPPAACYPPSLPPVPSPNPLSPEARSGEQKSRQAL